MMSSDWLNWTEALERHERIACGVSGGKDSTATAWLLRPYWDRIKFYHLDTGDELPALTAVVEQLKQILPNFTVVKRDVHAWIAANGLPSDLVPYTSDHLGQCITEAPRLVPLQACCWANIMQPLHERIKADGNTLVIRGTKRADMKRLPMQSGDVLDGLELLLPLQDWSNADVMEYLREQKAPISEAYDYFEDMADCATCSAWWGERRGAYLRQRHPALYERYLERLLVVMSAIGPSAQALADEMRAIGEQ
jgi:3'-phosphoadenosine 5'-phosphosulfate sulfotransferase (PAPS reductase)/FAD synthetase